MKKITIRSYAKINLSLDVLGRRPDGYHDLSMILQAIELHDDVTVGWDPDGEPRISISVAQSAPDGKREPVPEDERNIAYKAAALMRGRAGKDKGAISVDIVKRIPAAAGLAGGSGNGAAVVLALDALWETGLGTDELMELGGMLGADVPFQMMVQMKTNEALGRADDPAAATCALAKSTGTDLTPVKPLDAGVVLSTPDIAVSTKEVYEGIDGMDVEERPDNDALVEALEAGSVENTGKNMVNVLEKYTLSVYDIVYKKKCRMISCAAPGTKVLMSGSGPTVFAVTKDRAEAQDIFEEISTDGDAAFLTSTIS